jgi:hypothetical protein
MQNRAIMSISLCMYNYRKQFWLEIYIMGYQMNLNLACHLLDNR